MKLALLIKKVLSSRWSFPDSDMNLLFSIIGCAKQQAALGSRLKLFKIGAVMIRNSRYNPYFNPSAKIFVRTSGYPCGSRRADKQWGKGQVRLKQTTPPLDNPFQSCIGSESAANPLLLSF